MSEHDPVKVEIYLDDSSKPLGVYTPPASFDLDSTKLPDGPHKLRIKATDRAGIIGVREVAFIVRNGPGIAVVGLSRGDIVEGKIPVLVNAYAGASEEQWEPRRAETPAPIPTWSWVLFLSIVAWAMWYWAVAWQPAPQYANSPTFSSPEVIAAAAQATAGPTQPLLDTDFDWAQLGARVYEQDCEVCHAANGEGIPAFVPTLRGSAAVVAADPAEHLESILFGNTGPSRPPGPWRAWMPPFADRLSDEEVAAVANHLRTSWGHTAPLVGPQQVRAVRQQQRGRQ